MSNPAVITLANISSRTGKFKRFVIEDNIGESIHLHIDNIRIDFSINEFLEFSNMVRKSLSEMNLLCGYPLENFDEYFLMECADCLPKLKSIEIEEIKLSKLKCILHSDYKGDLSFFKIVPVSATPAYKYLKGNKEEFLNYRQYNYFNTNNEKRLLQTLHSIKTKGYPYNNEYIILFNRQNIIRDGQHRAAVLAHLYGLDYRAKIMRFHFDGKSHLIKINRSNFKIRLRWFINKIYRKLQKLNSHDFGIKTITKINSI